MPRVCRVVIDRIPLEHATVRTYQAQRHVHVYRRTMAGLRYVSRLFVILEYLSVVLVLAQNPVEDKTTFEAAFQGKHSLLFVSPLLGFMNSFVDAVTYDILLAWLLLQSVVYYCERKSYESSCMRLIRNIVCF